METGGGAPKTIDEYIAGFPAEVREILTQVRTTIRRAAPDAQEAIKYGIPTFVLNGNLVHFAGFKNHVGFYPTPSGIETFKDELSRYKDSTWNLMKQSGLKMIFCGAETGSDEMLARMNKGGQASTQLTLELAVKMRQYGIIPEYSFVLGNPPEPEKDPPPPDDQPLPSEPPIREPVPKPPPMKA